MSEPVLSNREHTATLKYNHYENIQMLQHLLETYNHKTMLPWQKSEQSRKYLTFTEQIGAIKQDF